MEVLFSDFKNTAEFDHTHAESDVTGLTAALAAKAASTHTHATSEVTGLDAALAGKSATGHDHAGVYSPVAHNHAGVYEPANANIQAHVISAHAPSGAQANADITKAEIEAKLTGEISSHTHAGSTPPTVATLAGDQATGANVTPVTLTGLVFNYVANSKYRIWFMGRVQPGAATTGCGFQFDLSSAVTAIDVLFYHQLAVTGTLSGGHSIADDASVGVSSGMPATSTYPVNGTGLLVTGANAGTAQLRLRSETTAVTTAKAGFTLVVEKIAWKRPTGLIWLILRVRSLSPHSVLLWGQRGPKLDGQEGCQQVENFTVGLR